MATWSQDVTLTSPAGLDALLSGLGTLTGAANATLDVAGTALDAAKLFLTGTASPQAAAAKALATAAKGLVTDIFGAGFFALFVHPWQHGVGRGEGPFRALSFPNLVAALRASFDDAGDPERPQFSKLAPLEMIVVVAGAPSPAIFGQTLDALATLIDAKEFRLARRRLAQAFELEEERHTLKVGSKLPDWHSATVREALPALAPLEASLLATTALLEGYATGADKAVDIASGLIAAKRAQLTTLQNRLNAASALFGQGLAGAGVYVLHVTGAMGNKGLQAELTAATGGAGPELSFCAGVAWVGVNGSLGGLAGVLGV